MLFKTLNTFRPLTRGFVLLTMLFGLVQLAGAFQHPGVGLTLADLNYIKTNLSNAPWNSGYSALVADGHSSTNYTMQGPFTYVNRNNAGNYDHQGAWISDMQAVYNLARMWYFTGDTNYAKKSHDILIAWATTQTNYGGIEASFDLGGYAYRYAGGADILRGTWPGWTAADTATVSNYFNNVFWVDLGFPAPMASGSQGMEPLTAAVAIAIFNDDTNKFNQVLTNILTDADAGFRDTHPNGEMGDTGRDTGHAGLYLDLFAWIAEDFWKQGVDIYSVYDKRIHACAEYNCRFNLGQTNLPFVPLGAPFMGVFNQIAGTPWGGLYGTTRNIVHVAYAERLGIQTPYIDLFGLSWDADSFVNYRLVDTSTATLPVIANLPATASVSSGLTSADLNGATPAGSTTYSSGTWTLRSGYNGVDPWNASVRNDTVRFVYKQVTGDFLMIAKVVSVSNVGSTSAKAGIMLRDSLTTAANRAWVAITPGTTYERGLRGWTALPYGANAQSLAFSILQIPYWVKMERVGQRIQTFTSINGGDWSPAGTADFASMPSTVYVGLFGASFVSGTLNTATFTDVRLTGGNGGEALKIPPAPFAIYASPGAGQVPLHWNESFTATNYTVLRSVDGVSYNPLVSVTNLFYVDTNVTPGTTYYYAVTATNFAGTSTNSLQDSVTAQLAPQDPPTGLTALPGNARATLFWIASDDAASYNVKRSTTSGNGYVLVTNIPGTSYTDTGLANGTTYYYVVSSVNGAGEGATSVEASVTPGASAATLFWSGAVNGSWDTSTMNWLNSGASATFADGNSVVLDDSAAANTAMNLSANRSPGIIFANNAAVSYTIGGSAIGGTGKLVKENIGTLTLNNANSFSGGSVIYNGTVTAGNNSALGSGAITLAGGTLNNNAGITITNNINLTPATTTALQAVNGVNWLISGKISGAGTVNQTPNGSTAQIGLSGDNSGFTGTWIENQSGNANVSLRFDNANAGSASAAWIFNDSQSQRTRFNFGNGTIHFGSLSGNAGSFGLANISSAGTTATLSVGALNTSTTFAGVMEANGTSAIALTKVGTGTLTMTGANTYTGLTTVSNGELIVSTFFAGKGNFLVTNAATLGVTNLLATSALVSNLTAAAGTMLEFLNLSNTAPALVTASNVTIGGSCTVKITSANNLVAGNSYPLVKYSAALNGFANLQLQMPYGWRGTLVNSGNQISLANVAVVSTVPPMMTFTNVNSQLQISWPADHIGWRLQVQTNALSAGLGTNWVDVPAAPSTNQLTLPISTTNGSVFYRLAYP